ncbi:unnamed protein product [Paramecium pentaurelia]|uniref:Uncharacterized protein n=1 Tax=Paramecium pentaurelia TaxID=43138 RepID=A0A8S1SXH0_9CILI|nr:unnamed protein product [Paramecium pentaurelia]
MGICSSRDKKRKSYYQMSDADNPIVQPIISEQELCVKDFIKSFDELNNLFQKLAQDFNPKIQSYEN